MSLLSQKEVEEVKKELKRLYKEKLNEDVEIEIFQYKIAGETNYTFLENNIVKDLDKYVTENLNYKADEKGIFLIYPYDYVNNKDKGIDYLVILVHRKEIKSNKDIAAFALRFEETDDPYYIISLWLTDKDRKNLKLNLGDEELPEKLKNSYFVLLIDPKDEDLNEYHNLSNKEFKEVLRSIIKDPKLLKEMEELWDMLNIEEN